MASTIGCYCCLTTLFSVLVGTGFNIVFEIGAALKIPGVGKVIIGKSFKGVYTLLTAVIGYY